MEELPLHSSGAVRADPIQLPQVIPNGVCQTCSVCCRFPEAESFLRPHFTPDEIRRAIAAGLSAEHFSDMNGCQISLVPNPAGEGYLCPAFDPETSGCRIYDARPFDCQVYPLAIMWSADGQKVLLGWDAKCPFVVPALGRGASKRSTSSGSVAAEEDADALARYAESITVLVEQEPMLARFAANPGLVTCYQDDVQVLRPLPMLSERLMSTSVARLRPLAIGDRPVIEAALGARPAWLSCYAFPPHYIWRTLHPYFSREIVGHLCLFAETPDGLFMPLPPLGKGSLKDATDAAFSVMQERNGGSSVSRIEGVSEELKPQFEALGYCLTTKDGDYLYRAADLAALTGDRYKSQRHACNQFASHHRYRVELYTPVYREACLSLYRRWAAQQQSRGLDHMAIQMLEDAASAHAVGITHAEALGLTGLVVLVEEALCAYTLGYALSCAAPAAQVYCVLFEIADRSIPGLAQFIFRECCRRAEAQGYHWINTMDDSGLPFLAHSKAAYHPVRIVPNYIATLPRKEC